MSVTESRRLALVDHVRSAWGEDAATTLMDLLPPDPAELATHADLSLLRVDLARTQGDLRVEAADLRTQLRTEMSELRKELHDDMGDLRDGLRSELSAVTRTYVLSSIGTVISIVAAVGLLR